jgi:hypothetical protein
MRISVPTSCINRNGHDAISTDTSAIVADIGQLGIGSLCVARIPPEALQNWTSD